MKPVKTSITNCTLAGTTDNVGNLPVTLFKYEDGTPAVQSCWELDEKDMETIKKTGKIYFTMYGSTHAPMFMAVDPFIKEDDEIDS